MRPSPEQLPLALKRPATPRTHVRSALALASAAWCCCACLPYFGHACGTYVASYPWGTSTIVLRRDHTFDQTIQVSGDSSATLRGQWDGERAAFGTRVVLRNVRLVTDSEGRLSPGWRSAASVVLSAPIERIWLRVVLGSDEEPYPYYRSAACE